MLRVLIIDESRTRAAELCAGLALAGHQVAAVLPTSQDLTAQIEAIKPDIILIETDSPSRDTLENLAVMNREMPRPVIIFSQEGDQGTIRAAYLYGNLAGVVRPDSKGGDLVEFNSQSWLVVKVLETWPDWCKVAIVYQGAAS